jgi:hypothetical protein
VRKESAEHLKLIYEIWDSKAAELKKTKQQVEYTISVRLFVFYVFLIKCRISLRPFQKS